MDNKELFLKLLHCNTYQHVEELLIKENYWNDKNAWRIYGDSESNMNVSPTSRRCERHI